MPGDNDHMLLAAARSGDHRSFERLVRNHQARVFSLALRMLGNRADAEDVLQETFIALYKNLDRFQERSKLSTYLYRLAANFSLMKLRQAKAGGARIEPLDAGAEIASTLPTPLERAEAADLRKQLERSLMGLAAAERAVVVLRDVQGIDGREVARVLGISLPAMKSRLHRGREALRRMMLDNTDPEDSP